MPVADLYEATIAALPPAQQQLVLAVYEECEANYCAGGDIVVETFTPEEIVQQFKTVKDAVEYCGLHADNATNYREGTDSDPELKAYDAWKAWYARFC